MFSTNPSSTINEDPVDPILDVSVRPDEVTSSEPLGPPLRFRFVGDRSRTRKRRKTNTTQKKSAAPCGSDLQDNLFASSADFAPVLAGENPERTGDGQPAHDIQELVLESRGVSLLNEFDHCDSSIPSLFEPASWLDFEFQDSLHAEPAGLMSLPRTPFSVTERAIELMPDGELNNDPQEHNFGPLVPDAAQREILNGGEMALPSTSPCFHTATAILGLSSNDHDWLFQLYDSEFCVLPLTSDIAVNPFRLHALCYWELGYPPGACTFDASGWDATLALISRQCPILDRSYVEYLVRWEKQDEWSFFDLTGCPRDLLVLLYNLAELARQSEIASSMKWLTFNIAPVVESELKLKQWQNNFDPIHMEQNPNLSIFETEEQLHEQQDRYHCAEAWRCALLIYVESVFKRDGQKRSFALTHLVRRTLDHIRCCRRASQTQKQLLLPIFLAGSETSNQGMRDYVKEYCAYWGEKSRYSMFNSVPMLLDEIWATGKWWGAVIDSKTRSTPTGVGKSSTQLLLG
ncbi:hypothetical protein N7467_002058 [Penicillium canescens]|nr:hypothetical protein N7467_002058 [Penicillium canescens]